MTTDIVQIIAWGNRGRRDDGVGLALAERLAYRLSDRSHVVVQQHHQLGPELVYDLHECRLAIFVDAHVCPDKQDVSLEVVRPSAAVHFNTHHCRPAELLALARSLELRLPEALQVGVRAYDLGFGDELSRQTASALITAEELIISLVDGAADPVKAVCHA